MSADPLPSVEWCLASIAGDIATIGELLARLIEILEEDRATEDTATP